MKLNIRKEKINNNRNNFNCFGDYDNSLWGCGLNSYGQLAQGNFQEYYTDFVKIDFIK